MNAERLRLLADAVEPMPRTPDVLSSADSGRYFDMSVWLDRRDLGADGCRTIACLAGHAVDMFLPEDERETLDEDVKQTARRLLGLDELQAEALFQGELLDPETDDLDLSGPLTDVDGRRAARACRRLADGVGLDRIWEDEGATASSAATATSTRRATSAPTSPPPYTKTQEIWHKPKLSPGCRPRDNQTRTTTEEKGEPL